MSPEERLGMIASYLGFVGISPQLANGDMKTVLTMVEDLVYREAGLRAQVEMQRQTLLGIAKDRVDFLHQLTCVQAVSTTQS